MSQVPVVSINASGLEGNPGFKMGGAKFVNVFLMATLYGDVFMRTLYATRPYEAIEGTTDALYDYWRQKAKATIATGNLFRFKKKKSRQLLKISIESLEKILLSQRWGGLLVKSS